MPLLLLVLVPVTPLEEERRGAGEADRGGRGSRRMLTRSCAQASAAAAVGR